MKVDEFDAKIMKHPEIDAAYIDFPYDVEVEFGVKGQVKVLATFDGYEYRGSLSKMGHTCHRLGLTQAIRNAIGKQPDDMVHVIIKQDIEPRIVEIPEDFLEQLNENQKAKDFFDTLSYTNKKEFVVWISSAKRAETREKRITDAIDMLLNNIKRH
jgi:hypothetical protein